MAWFPCGASTCQLALRAPTTGAASRVRSVLLRPDPIIPPGLKYGSSGVALASNPALVRGMNANNAEEPAGRREARH